MIDTLAALAGVVRRAFKEFLALPTAVIAGFLLLALASYALDRSEVAWLGPLRVFLRSHVFANPRATSDLLGAVAGGLIAVTSITISLLLVAVQQTAASMSSAVFDQFLRRRTNQLYFGFFVGLSLYALVTLATVNDPFNPVFGATLAFLLTVAALYLLIALLYTSINQMRPAEIVETIHDHVLAARCRQSELLRRTRRRPAGVAGATALVRTRRHGYVTRIDLDALGAAVDGSRGEAEIVLCVSIGAFVAFGDVIAEVRSASADMEAVDACLRAVILERQRDITMDAAYGIEQLEMIAWTSISTSKSNPAPGLLTIRSLRDILARWAEDVAGDDRQAPLPVVYTDDVIARLLGAFETFAVVSSESMQHQNYIEVLDTLSVMFGRLPAEQRERAADVALRILPALGDHVLTTELDAALRRLTEALERSLRPEAARAVRRAHDRLAESVGRLNSRSTRVPKEP